MTTKLPSTVCTYSHALCGFWASAGECTANPAYMLANCYASCAPQMCPFNGQRPGKIRWFPAKTTTYSTELRLDRSSVLHLGFAGRVCAQFCLYGVEMSSGVCTRLPRYVRSKKSKTSTFPSGQVIQTTRKPCNDETPMCATWAMEGECTRSAAFMHDNCRKACMLC